MTVSRIALAESLMAPERLVEWLCNSKIVALNDKLLKIDEAEIHLGGSPPQKKRD
jgi:hypothetical protein